MKVSLNVKFIEGPYGGGMQFAKYLHNFLTRNGITAVTHLNDDDIDFIVHINPFIFKSAGCAYSFFEAYRYKLRHPNAVIIQRINECDERKKTDYMNQLLVKVSRYSDYIVYIASWLRPLMEKSGLDQKRPWSVILNGADEKVFNMTGKQPWDGQERLKIVTHHWGGHYMKGHDIYKRLDTLLAQKEYQEKYELTLVGNHPKDISYENTSLIPPLHGDLLADELRKHHVYLTASRNEPGGMHHIEGALSGLPLLYINSGALPEYCEGFGIEFTEHNFESKLQEMHDNYRHWFEQIQRYNRTAKVMAEAYLQLFHTLSDKKATRRNESSQDLLVHLKIIAVSIYGYLYDFYWRLKLFVKHW